MNKVDGTEIMPVTAGAVDGLATPAGVPAAAGAMGIAAVERDTGISKETLRVWERRYGFPVPLRDAAGERVYPPEQVQRLRLLKRLLDGGHRPGRVVGASADSLQALSQVFLAQPQQQQQPGLGTELQACMDQLRAHDLEGLRRSLSQAVLRLGLSQAVISLLAPLTLAVGEAWIRGELQVFEEHAFSECLQQVLRLAIQAIPVFAQGEEPRVLLTTLPGEQHALGLLMAEALLSLEGCHCLSLGGQTPLEQVARATLAHRADIVALSFSGYLSVRSVQQGLAALRASVPPEAQIWAGGASRALRQPQAGVVCLNKLEAIAPAVSRWRADRAAA